MKPLKALLSAAATAIAVSGTSVLAEDRTTTRLESYGSQQSSGEAKPTRHLCAYSDLSAKCNDAVKGPVTRLEAFSDLAEKAELDDRPRSSLQSYQRK